MKNRPILLQVFLGQIVERGAKPAQCPQDGLSVLRGWHDPNIDIHSGRG